jgi:putative transport protein
LGFKWDLLFFASFKKDGLRLNGLAFSIVFLGVLITIVLGLCGWVPFPVAVGLFSGATTNTPSLAAAQQALKEIPSITDEMLKMPGLGYAVSYPFGIVGIILTMLFMRFIFKIRPAQEVIEYTQAHQKQALILETLDIAVQNPNLNGCHVEEIPAIQETGVVVSRILHSGEVQLVSPDSRVYIGDIIRVVGPKEKLDEIQMIVGARAKIETITTHNALSVKRILVTRKEVIGKTIEELEAFLYGVTVTRISRSQIEFPATQEIEIHFADTLVVVGEEAGIQKFAKIIGNSEKDLDHPQLIPVFLGVALGVLVGSIPFSIPGMPAAVKLGLAGGPLVVAILLSRIGRVGRLVWYMPNAANFMLREVGISLFLACVGLRAGDRFIETLVAGEGLKWIALAAVITLLPIFFVALWARLRYRMNYLTLCGLLAGSMTDPPALAYANQMAPSSAQVVAYAGVYPLVMLVRVISAQMIVMFFVR